MGTGTVLKRRLIFLIDSGSQAVRIEPWTRAVFLVSHSPPQRTGMYTENFFNNLSLS
jgi:hypothetical protein